MYSLALSCVVAFIASAGLTVGVRRLSVRCRAIDHPDGERKLHSKATPLWGGAGVFLAMVLGVFAANHGAFVPGSGPLALTVVVLLVAGAFCLLGAVDDCHALKSRRKLLLQVVTLLALVSLGYHFHHIDVLGKSVALGWLGYPITIAWLLGCINAFNLLDGSDGLAATIGTVAGLLIVVVAMAAGHTDVAIMGGALAGATGGFLIHNRPSAKIFLGDSGSMVIGLMVGILSVEAAVTPKGDLVIVFPVVLMCLPLLDSLLALVRRRLSGRPFDEPDREHIHHRLLQRGMSPWRVLIALSGMFLVTGIAAAASVLSGYRAIGWTTAVTLVAWLARAQWFGHHEWGLTADVIRRWRHGTTHFLRTRFARPSSQNKSDQDRENRDKKTSRRKAA